MNDSDMASNFFGVAPVQFGTALSLAALEGSDLSLKKIGSYFSNATMLVRMRQRKIIFYNSIQNIRSFNCIHMRLIAAIMESR